MKTTLNLDDALLRRAKKLAAERGVTLTSVIEDALRAHLTAPAEKRRYRFRMPVVKDTSPPSVDPADREALYELLEGRI